MIISNTDAYRIYPNSHPKGKLTAVSVKHAPQSREADLLKVLQMSDTALKTRSEKFTFTFTYFMLGSCSRSSLCWGVNSSLASAWMPYLSKVQCVLSSQVLFFSHQRAWSDQSFFTSINSKQ